MMEILIQMMVEILYDQWKLDIHVPWEIYQLQVAVQKFEEME